MRNQRKNSRPSFPSQPIVMFSNVKKYSKNFIQESKKSNDQNVSLFGTFQTPLPLWKNEEVSNTCSIFCRTAQFTALQSCIIRVRCIAMHIGAIYWLLSILQSIGCLPSTKSTHHNLLLLLLLHTYLLLCDEWPNPLCTIVHYKLCSIICLLCNV